MTDKIPDSTGSMSFIIKNAAGMKKEITMKDIANWKVGKNENFMVRTWHQVKTLFSPDVLVTDSDVKKIMKSMDAAQIKAMAGVFKEAIKNPKQEGSQATLELMHEFSQLSSLFGEKTMTSASISGNVGDIMKAVKQLNQTYQLADTMKTLESMSGKEFLTVLALNTPIAKDFSEFCEGKGVNQDNIEATYQQFIEHVKSEGLAGNVKPYANEPALRNFSIIQSKLNFLNHLEKGNLNGPDLYKAIQNPESSSMMERVFESIGKKAEFKSIKKYADSHQAFPENDVKMRSLILSSASEINSSDRNQIKRDLDKSESKELWASFETNKKDVDVLIDDIRMKVGKLDRAKDDIINGKVDENRLEELIKDPDTRQLMEKIFTESPLKNSFSLLVGTAKAHQPLIDKQAELDQCLNYLNSEPIRQTLI